MAAHPSLATNVMQTMGDRLQEAHTRVKELSTEEVEHRVAHTLLRLIAQSGRKTEEGVLIDFPITHQDLAQASGTTFHSVSRVLRCLGKRRPRYCRAPQDCHSRCARSDRRCRAPRELQGKRTNALQLNSSLRCINIESALRDRNMPPHEDAAQLPGPNGSDRSRAAANAIPLFSYGFRPFFLGAALWAVIAMALWIGSLAGLWPLAEGYGALAWHAHEMIFGYSAAVVAGFLLTAVPNWTGRLPVAGWRLLLLFLLWCAARVAFLVTGWTGPLPAVVLDSLFLPCLLLLMAREVVVGRNWRNLKPLVLVAVLAAADIGFHVEVLSTGTASTASRVGRGGADRTYHADRRAHRPELHPYLAAADGIGASARFIQPVRYCDAYCFRCGAPPVDLKPRSYGDGHPIPDRRNPSDAAPLALGGPVYVARASRSRAASRLCLCPARFSARRHLHLRAARSCRYGGHACLDRRRHRHHDTCRHDTGHAWPHGPRTHSIDAHGRHLRDDHCCFRVAHRSRSFPAGLWRPDSNLRASPGSRPSACSFSNTRRCCCGLAWSAAEVG